MSATYLVLKESKEQNASVGNIGSDGEMYGYGYLVLLILLVSLYLRVFKQKESL